VSWLKVDDNFASHPKTVDLSWAAKGVWVHYGSWCAAHPQQGGYVPEGLLKKDRVPRKAIEELLASGLWESEEGGVRYHDWDQYQPSAQDAREKKKSRSEAAKLAADARWGKRDGSYAIDATYATHDATHMRSHDANAMRQNAPDPTRPDPKASLSNESDSAPPKRRGSRVPEDFTITAELREWAKRETPLVNVDQKLGEWMDYWRGVAGATGVKLDWQATWRNGMKKQQQWAERDRATAPVVKAANANDWMDRSTKRDW
jgi:hypothetical protein